MAHRWAEMLHNPLHSRDKIRIGCLSPALWGAHKRAEMLHNPCILGGPQMKEDKIRIGPQVGENAT